MTMPSDPAVQVPLVLVWAGNDPSGGAGMAADCAALLSHGCHPCPAVTALTVQDTRGVQRLEPVSAALVEDQARAVLDDLPVAAFKVGVVGSRANVEAIQGVVADFPHIPLVLDPVLHGGRGGSLSEDGLEAELLARLVPLATVVTPNAAEAARLVPCGQNPAGRNPAGRNPAGQNSDGQNLSEQEQAEQDLDRRAEALLARGSDYVLLTGADTPGDEVVNRLYGPAGLRETYKWRRLPGGFHGTGCTLASSLTGLLAQGVAMTDAVLEAQAFTWQAIEHALHCGRGQALPDRLFWAREQGDEGNE